MEKQFQQRNNFSPPQLSRDPYRPHSQVDVPNYQIHFQENCKINKQIDKRNGLNEIFKPGQEGKKFFFFPFIFLGTCKADEGRSKFHPSVHNLYYTNLFPKEITKNLLHMTSTI